MPCPSHPAARHSARPRPDVLVAFLRVGLMAADRALSATDDASVLHLVSVAHEHLLTAHDLIQTDRRLAA